MMLLLEGPDGAGKTTLAEKLAIPHQRTHHGPMLGSTTAEMFKAYGDSFYHYTIVDRAHPSEAIYAKILKRKDRLAHNHRPLNRLLWSLQGVIVKCLPPLDVCLEATKDRPELLKTRADHDKIWHEYERWTPKVPYVTYDWTKHDVGQLRRLVNMVKPAVNQGPGLGNWSPGNVDLIVGEAPGPGNPWGKPFTHPGGCSYWLHKQMDAAGIAERDLYWVNASDGVRPTPHGFVERLRPRQVYALGRVAAQWCAEAGVDAIELPHPQWERRFKANQQSSLVRRLA